MDILIGIKAAEIYEQENLIDENQKVYGITWSPDPKELPDSDFYMQHQVNVTTLVDYLKFCKCGIFCVESTQIGNPHYHGWYQVNSATELQRIAVVKTLKRFGELKITELKHIKINKWYEKGNALWYYKKDLLDSFLEIDPNPITSKSVTTMNFEACDICSFLTNGKSMKTVTDHLSSKQFYRSFYADTIGSLR